jgi:MerR family transcriptional regulator, light-induced transcriptional regulator
MRTLKTREAASLLRVSPNTLRTWERKFGYPRPLGAAGRHRSYNYAEIIALRDALKRGLSVPSAISVVREGIGADTDTLLSSLGAFNARGADQAMEASLALRSLERTVEELLLPALDEIRRRNGPASAVWAAAHRWGVDWLSRAGRLSLTEDGQGVLMGDASGELSAARPSIRALELFCVRGGLDVLVVPVVSMTGLAEAVAAIEPLCLVAAGSRASDEQIGRWLREAGRLAGGPPVALYLQPPQAPRDEQSHVLSPVPIEAQRELIELVARARVAKRASSTGETNRFAQSG